MPFKPKLVASLRKIILLCMKDRWVESNFVVEFVFTVSIFKITNIVHDCFSVERIGSTLE